MRRVGRNRHQLSPGLWRADTREEVHAELEFHLEMLTREFMQRGLSPDEARAEAVKRFGNPAVKSAESLTSARQRDSQLRRQDYFADLAHDVRFAVRQLSRSRSFTSIVLLTLGIGIAATTTIFSVVRSVILRPFPAEHPERVMYVAEKYLEQSSNFSIGNFVDVQRQSTSFEALAAIVYQGFNITEGEAPERVLGARVSASLFTVTGARAALGRVFTSEEDAPGSDDVVLLSDGLWTRRYARDPAVIGKSLRLNMRPYRVIGVMPPSFDPTATAEQLWVPAAFTPAQRAQHDEHYIDVLGLLKPGVSRARASSELDALMKDLAKQYPDANVGRGGRVTSVGEIVVGDAQKRLLVLFGAVLLVLLIACANVANLLLARGAARAKEIAIRTAIGAGRGRLIRQLLTETAIVALAASALGVTLAAVLLRFIVRWGPPSIPRLKTAGVDAWVVAFAILVALLCSVLAGLVPALRSARRDAQMDLREGGRSGGGVRDRLRNALITAEVAIALTLLIGSGLLIRTSIAMQRIDPGFDPRGTLMARLSLPEVTYKEPEHIVQTLTRLTQTLAEMPGVRSAAVTSQAPMGPGGGSNGLVAEGNAPTPDHLVDARLRLITPGYLTLMGIPLKAGRVFNDRDVQGSDRVMILSEPTARRLWPGDDPIGKRVLCCEGSETDPRTKTVVGVVGAVRSAGLNAPVDPEFYLPIAQSPPLAWDWIQRSVTLVVKGTTGDPAALVGQARAAVHDIDPAIPLDRISTMSQAIESSLAPARFNTILLSTLGMIGLILAAVGIYGVVSYFVSVRIREIGVRVALGASRADILRLMTWQGVRPIVAGVALGAIGALGATRALESALVGVGARDPFTFVGVAAVLLVVGTLASLVPARRALRVQPTRALQE